MFHAIQVMSCEYFRFTGKIQSYSLGGVSGSALACEHASHARDLGPDYQNACKVTMFSTLYLELRHESYNVPAMLYKSGSSKIYKFIVGRLYVLLRRAHCSQHMATYNM